MKWFYLVLFICLVPSGFCYKDAKSECTTFFILGGLTILIMLFIIIGLSLALYMIKSNKTIFGIKLNGPPTFLKQESSTGATLRNVGSTNDIIDQCRNDGSTLTVNSGIVEIGVMSEPQTPIRMEETKSFSYIKKPTGSIKPPFQKAQMDVIIQDVLNRRQKSDSATFREIDALARQTTTKNGNNDYKKNTASFNELDRISNDDIGESLYGNALTINLMKNKAEVKDKPIEPLKYQATKTPKIKFSRDQIDAGRANLPVADNGDEQEVYDTLPNPVRCRNSDNSEGTYVEALHLYDMPPARNWDTNENRNVVMDHDTQYLLPLSKKVEGHDDDKTSYINAKDLC